MEAFACGRWSLSSNAVRFRAVPTVTLRVGNAKVPFQVHLGILCDASPVFNAAFHGGFSEGLKRSMNLPEDDPEAFELLVQWLYLKTYNIPQFVGKPHDDDQIGFMHLARLYVAADKYGIIGLMKDVMDRWCKARWEHAQVPFTKVLDYVYENTTSKSKLRETIVAHYVWNIGYEWYKNPTTKGVLHIRPDFATDVAVAMSERITGNQKNLFSLGSSDSHEAIADTKGSE